jgi:beta-lactamase superfamily II metal-dependent hydrolase
MVTLEALNALAGDCLLLRYPGPDGTERLWIIDGGPKRDGAKNLYVWRDVLLPRLKEINPAQRLPVALGMVSHIDDDHINGIQKLTDKLRNATASQPKDVEFARFWFNSFDDLVGPKPASAAGEAATASLQSLVDPVNVPGVDDEHATMIMQSVPQGNSLASDLRALNLQGNKPVGGFIAAMKGQKKIPIDGAQVTILGPLQGRLDKLREEWAKALSKPDKPSRQAALQSLFLPASKQDKSVPNLSSIVVLVEIGNRKLLLTGDAHGDDIVTAWQDDLDMGTQPVKIDLLKMPHHGSIRNCTARFLTFFLADHYVFSADGKYDNPDPPTVEAVVKLHGDRGIKMYFTNEDVTWSASYTLEKGGKKVGNLKDLLASLHQAYPGTWKETFRAKTDKSVVVTLP